MKVVTVPNNGEALSSKSTVMYNQCLWISIKDYLETIDIEVPVDEIRKIAGLTHHTQRSLWDEDKPWAIPALQKVCDEFELKIEIYHLIEDEEDLLIDPIWIINDKPRPRFVLGEGKNQVQIANYNEHFELLVTKIET